MHLDAYTIAHSGPGVICEGCGQPVDATRQDPTRTCECVPCVECKVFTDPDLLDDAGRCAACGEE